MDSSKDVRITVEPPARYEEVFRLYQELNWDSLGLTVAELQNMCQQSWYVLYAHQGNKLVGMGRIVSDGVITGLICGVGVLPSYQGVGIGRMLMNGLIEQCDHHRIIPQLMCTEDLESYYEAMGFKKFAIGMTRERKKES
ncbi:GNAT family N-acetyltransferase [Planococcus sp. N064]|uniref:GNAT family N-acetyltransferase n=1 Tax=Planococcus liqunii TaxID=3058394 RepID=A0ABT8MTD7_9BACL|nr:GNAT family N-acetyltransferase [Planococcus sp. N064]MDN7228058.1 GNAT family N-acetyltransferase [Planococcus sp. N064]